MMCLLEHGGQIHLKMNDCGAQTVAKDEELIADKFLLVVFALI